MEMDLVVGWLEVPAGMGQAIFGRLRGLRGVQMRWGDGIGTSRVLTIAGD